jgi:hypothetical protein
LRDNNSGIVTNPFTDISELSVSAAAQVMDFVKRLPGFHGVPPIDRQILLKSGCLEIMVRKVSQSSLEHVTTLLLLIF